MFSDLYSINNHQIIYVNYNLIINHYQYQNFMILKMELYVQPRKYHYVIMIIYTINIYQLLRYEIIIVIMDYELSIKL